MMKKANKAGDVGERVNFHIGAEHCNADGLGANSDSRAPAAALFSVFGQPWATTTRLVQDGLRTITPFL